MLILSKRHPHRHIYNIWPNRWVPCDPVKLTHEIKHHTYFIMFWHTFITKHKKKHWIKVRRPEVWFQFCHYKLVTLKNYWRFLSHGFSIYKRNKIFLFSIGVSYSLSVKPKLLWKFCFKNNDKLSIQNMLISAQSLC